MTILSLASRETWPHILTAVHLKPQRVVLLHSNSPSESREPANRLAAFFEKTQLVENVALREIPHDDCLAIEARLDAIVEELGLERDQCSVHFTGGNKLMATAAFRWATAQGITAFYLERGSTLTWFEFQNGDLLTRSRNVDGGLTNQFDAVDLLTCQIDASEIERPGEILTLNEVGRSADFEQFFVPKNRKVDHRPFLKIINPVEDEFEFGFYLEYNTAAVLLKLGVPSVHRSLRLKSRLRSQRSSDNPHQEVDLIFNWNGQLWVVDCKDESPSDSLVNKLPADLLASSDPGVQQLLGKMRNKLRVSQTKVLKLDLIAAREIGGLRARTLCVRRSLPPDEVVDFAEANQIEIILKEDLTTRLRALLYPQAKPAEGDLTKLAEKFSG